jgi:predicted ester cyclase
MTHTGDFNGIPATGKRVTFGGTTIMRFSTGKVVERWSESDFLGILKQLGVVPEAA